MGPARGRGRGRGNRMPPPPPLMARNNMMPPLRSPPLMPPRMRHPPPPGMRGPPFAPPHPPHPPRRPPPPGFRGIPPRPPRLPPGPLPPPSARRFPPRPMFPGPHGPPLLPLPPGPPMMDGPHARLRRPPGPPGGPPFMPFGPMDPMMKKWNVNNQMNSQPATKDNYCVTCERGFKTEEELATHCAGHVTCGVDGCQLTADQKVIDNHYNLQHKTGLFKRLALEPADVQKWIEERKRRFPTKKNVQENKERLEEMEKRGERLHKENGRFGKRKGGNQADDQPAKIRKVEPNKPKQKLMMTVLKDESEREFSWRGDLPHFAGTALYPPAEDEMNKDEMERRILQMSKQKWRTTISVMRNGKEIPL
ncbi:nuclear fragile X mental retardation-interacting protein 1 [Nilaparvata lugens]|uniref:nuclear fragile X mental retardation-interacting protein 1 n=1 Tax=Nilaparvata lugens TaxID=108931 RepID=UPI00193EC1DD|nr:nuclear fragile X mental retardation-interacting protein 1 [Nilaparvata lugens]